MKYLLLLVFFLYSFAISGQEVFIDSIINPLQKEQLLFEKVFIHTNKTSYFNDDIIWFKAYVGESSNKPSLKTTLLYVNLIDAKGKLIFSNNVLIHKGVGQGQFKLNETIKTEVVYIQAYTNHMRNFGEDNYYLQKVKILNNVITPRIVKENNYDIQVFPEGGYLLEETENVIGVKSLINGKGVEFSGEIIDSKHNKITSFKNEYLGMTKCKFLYENNEEYYIRIELNDTIITQKIPKARKKGVIVNLNNNNDKYLSLNLKTNKKTLKEKQKGQKFRLLFHQQNKIVDFLEISNLDSLNVQLEIDKKTLFNGVNTLTVFNGIQPISERKFYVEKPSKDSSLQLVKEKVINDSIQYKLQVLDNLEKPIIANLSLAVLALNGQNNIETTNIKSAFLLSPYIKGHIENPSNYFNKKNTKRKSQFDLLLLTQGWTQYSARKMITDLNPRSKYNFEQGFKLKGTVTPLLTNYLGLMSKNNVLIDKLFLNGKTDFSFDKLLVYKGDSVKVSFLDNQNVAIKPKTINFDSLKLRSFPKLEIKSNNLLKLKKVMIQDDFLKNINSDVTKLDVVNLKGKKRSEKFIKRKKFIEKHKDLVWDIGKYYQLELDDKYTSDSDLMYYLNREENVRIVNWRGIEYYLSTPNGEAILFIDGKQIHSSELNGVYIKMEDIENISVASGEKRKSRVYQVFTKDNYKNNIQELFIDFVIQNGYNKIKKYYSPMYNYEGNVRLIEIDWKPNLMTNDLGEVFFKIKKNSLDDILFSINGFSRQGYLINENVNSF